MALCSRCRQRKAKRTCPALGSSLCSLCCGLARNKDIPCPDSCPVLAEHRPYQERRTAGQRDSASSPVGSPEDILQDERLAWLAYNVEFPLKAYGEKDADLTDGHVVLALEYARDKLAKAGRLLILPGESLRPSNPLGEAVLHSMDNCRYERTLILPGAGPAYSPQERVRVLDRVLLTARELGRRDPQGRVYLDQLFRHFARIEERARTNKTGPRA
jgi:hypothetical protein